MRDFAFHPEHASHYIRHRGKFLTLVSVIASLYARCLFSGRSRHSRGCPPSERLVIFRLPRRRRCGRCRIGTSRLPHTSSSLAVGLRWLPGIHTRLIDDQKSGRIVEGEDVVHGCPSSALDCFPRLLRQRPLGECASHDHDPDPSQFFASPDTDAPADIDGVTLRRFRERVARSGDE
jgi:hypothetical protein